MTDSPAASMLPAATRDALRADVLPCTFGVIVLALAVVGLAVLVLRRRRDLGLATFLLCTGLYGARLLAASHAARLLFGLSPLASDTLQSVMSYLLLLPFVLFCGSLMPPSWRPLVRGLAWLSGLFAAGAIAWETLTHSPGALGRWSSAIVLAAALVLLGFIVRPGETSTWELRRLRFSFAGMFVFVAGENLRSLGILRWPEGVEPVGFFLFLVGLGTIVARRVIANETRLADVRRELETARRIQASILPRELPKVGGLEIAVRYLPAEDVAGDYYDFLPGKGRRLGILVADVSGHGVAAALIASMIKVAVAAQEGHADSPAQVMTGMNRIFHGKLRDQFITAAYVFIDLEAGTVTWANAGHPPPLLLTAGGCTELAPTGGVMGRLSRADYGESTLPIAPGDRLAIFTDGIPEAPSPTGELFGDERLAHWLADHADLAPEALVGALVADLDRFSGSPAGSGVRADDLTLVAMRLSPPVAEPGGDGTRGSGEWAGGDGATGSPRAARCR